MNAPTHKEYQSVGRLSAHGIKGELFVRLAAEKADWLDKLTLLRVVSTAGVVKEYVVERKSVHKDGLIVKVKGIDDRNTSEALKGSAVEIPIEYLQSEAGDSLYLKEILGFEVIDRNLGSLGPVLSFESNGRQDLLVVKPGKTEQLIPFIKEFVEELDMKSKKIFVRLPEGLVEANG